MPVPMPASMPLQLLAGHDRQDAPSADICEFEAGHPRIAPLDTASPTTMTVRWNLTQAQFDAYHEWYEDDLAAGALSFALPVAREGGDPKTTALVESMWLAPPTERYHGRLVTGLGAWTIEGQVVTGVTLAAYGTAPPVQIGWMTVIDNPASGAAAANSGSATWT